VKSGKMGGVWQAAEHGCTYFGFFMVHYDMFHVSRVDKTLKYLNDNEYRLKLCDVKNENHITKGYPILTDHVRHLFEFSHELIKMNGYRELKNEYFPECRK